LSFWRKPESKIIDPESSLPLRRQGFRMTRIKPALNISSYCEPEPVPRVKQS